MRRSVLAILVAGGLPAALLAAPAPASAVPANGSTVFVNELHYDNDGTDSGEFVEIAGPAGTDLSGWSVVLYNGNNGETYGTRNLSGAIPDAQGGYGAVSLSYPSNGIQNGGQDAVALVNGDDVVQLLSYEGTMTAVGGPADGLTSTDIGVTEGSSTPAGSSLELRGTGTTYGDFSWALSSGSNTAGQPNTGQTFGAGGEEPPPPPNECGDPATLIHQIQGSGDEFDPAFGGTQSIEGVVTAAMLGGVFVQEEASDVDGNPLTSEGIFVFLSGQDAPEVGSVVRATGTVTEFGGKTELTNVDALEVCGVAETPIEPADVSFPLASPDDLERFEGMQVELVDELVISEYFNYDRFGEVVVAAPPNGWDRLYTPTSVVDPGAPANALAAEYERRTITIDDVSTEQNPSVIPHPGNGEPFSLDNRFRGGDTITGIQGVLDEGFGSYRLQPTEYGDYTRQNPRPADAPDVGGDLHVASFNVLNYFLTLDQGGNQCGPQRNQDCRGADNANELERQRAKILSALAELDADVVGLMEMENTTGVEPAADLAAGLNEILGAGTYAALDTGVIGTDAIRVGFLYKPGTVRPVGDFAVLTSADDPRFNDEKNRPMLTQTFDTVSAADGDGSGRFTVSVNHLKSKGSDCEDLGDPDTGDGQGNCNLTRTKAARAIVDYLAQDPTNSGDPDQLIIGDLNSYDHEDPIRALEAGGFVDQVKRFGGELAYSYVFDGQAGYLDHALANQSLTGQVTGTSVWHINADEPGILDYDTSFKPDAIDAIYAPNEYRSSDHDPVLVGLDLAPATPARCYTDGAQSVASYSPGVRGNGTDVPPAFTDPTEALGLSDPDSDDPYWATLGLGGQLTLEFDRPVQNLGGTDLRVVDAADGAKGRSDSATVLASSDGESWVEVGEVSGTGEVDLGTLSSARFVRVVDTTPDAGPRSVDGYDVDAVEVLSGCA
ncbi:MAG TPA: ExeM/NucH family extracellular endonuclease [Nocardioidaceae bacterium]|nr:ExeM/NucH family extracellular endonuclease [Nocardioidaceae bacterium]